MQDVFDAPFQNLPLQAFAGGKCALRAFCFARSTWLILQHRLRRLLSMRTVISTCLGLIAKKWTNCKKSRLETRYAAIDKSLIVETGGVAAAQWLLRCLKKSARAVRGPMDVSTDVSITC